MSKAKAILEEAGKMANEGQKRYSDKAQKAIGDKMHKMKDEDRPQKQKVAIAISEARQKGYKVPNQK